MPGETDRTTDRWFTLDEFMDRAEVVLDSAIARREDMATLGTTLKLIASLAEGGSPTWRMEWTYPPEADVESAAARVRPLFLQQERVFHGRVMNALSSLSQGAPQQEQQAIKMLKKAWQSQDSGYRWALAVSKAPDLPGQGMRTDRQIARDFLYGDLVHADTEARARLQHIPRRERLLAAVVWVADAIRLTQATKQLFVDLRDGGYLSPRLS